MSLGLKRHDSQQFQNWNGQSSQFSGVVYDVILDVSHPKIQDGELNISAVGAIQFRYLGKVADEDDNLPIAYPFDKTILSLPIRNEIVEIYKTGANEIFYRRIGPEITPNGITNPFFISVNFPKRKSQEGTTAAYHRVESTGITKQSGKNESEIYDGYGNYFESEFNHKLKLYEGDTTIQSRFGQSIRFSAYNNDENEYSPTTIIRNRESELTRDFGALSDVVENPNSDGSTILLGSNRYKLNFIPGNVNDKNIGDFETRPQSFSNYPSELLGDQILINSGRIILSAKNAEMIFYSKKNYGFISDGALSIDNKLGMTINLGDHSNITTNGRDVNINTGSTGKINLGAGVGLESMVKGDTLLLLLNELITQIQTIIVATPAGPSSPPINAAAFSSIAGRLNTMLSKQNKTI